MKKYKINNYEFEKPLTSDNSGFSKWGIGRRGGKAYFVKEFLSPTYPVNDSIYDEKTKQKRIKFCDDYVSKQKKMYEIIRDASDGNVVVVEQFFRVGAKYYISTQAVTDKILTITEIAAKSFEEKLRLCCSIAHAMARLHERKIVHSDIKVENVLVVELNRTGMQPHIIDFDCSFFEDECPALGEELNGDMIYLSPEGFLHIAEIDSNVSCKSDVFSLGLLFYQYFTGEFPGFDNSMYQYAYEAVLDDSSLLLDKLDDYFCRTVISKMLCKEPERRLSMREVFNSINAYYLEKQHRKMPVLRSSVSDIDKSKIKVDNEEKKVEQTKSVGFKIAGDL